MSPSAPRYAELQVTTYFSFLRGASSPIELFAQAKALGIEALSICDRNSLSGMVLAHVAAKEVGLRLVVGCRLDLADFPPVRVYPMDRAAYALKTGSTVSARRYFRIVFRDRPVRRSISRIGRPSG
ncbi:hypothetical protein HK23_10705 [Acetobacter malorum]|uniref:Polymerase/histidinol phosphatase N-terminal domain-containing protein n=1 Tax=Acetobacter malorum TaxID=178901 RepID=A0A1Y3G2S8_9PROT|nr:hypothetical protein HK23_10705 [Acetobacter malorum]